MADILSTLRELRSLEEKRAHGTLGPGEEERFQELQAIVSSRAPKPQSSAPTPQPPSVPATAWPAAAMDSSAAPISSTGSAATAEPPFVDADLTEDVAEMPLPSTSEATAMQPPAELTVIAALSPPMETAVIGAVASGEPLPSEAPVVEVSVGTPPVQGLQEPLPGAAPPEAPSDKTVPMSPAELRQWNASFSPQDADAGPDASASPSASTPSEVPIDVEEPTSLFSAPPEALAPAPDEWLAPTPLPAQPEAPPDVGPEPTVIDDDAPMVWTDPEAARALAAEADSRSAVSASGLLAGEAAADIKPMRLAPAAPAVDLTLGDAFEQAPSKEAEGDFPELTSKRMTPIGEAFVAGESRVVVHTLGGVQKRGSIIDAHMNADFLELRLPDGEREMLSTAALKAVFFVVPIGQDVPAPVGDPVTVTLLDGHQLAGLSPDYQVGAVGFFLCPTDQRSRTAKIYIYAGAVKGIS